MSPRIVGLFLLVVTGHFVSASGQNRSPSQTGKAQKMETQDRQQAPKQVKKMIVSLERRLWDADVASDAAPYSDLIAEDFEGIKHGLLFNAKDDALATKEYKLRFYGMSDERVRLIRPDIALLTYRVTWSGTFAGAELPKQPFYIASTWVKRAGHWKNVFYAETQPDFATAAYERLSKRTVILK